MKRYQLIAIIVVAIVVVAGAAVVISNRNGGSENTEINLISGLEGVGSGFYYDDTAIQKGDLFVLEGGEIKTSYHEGVGDVAIFKPAGWEHLIFGVPTVGSIQYYQLKTIVEVYLNDASYTDGTTKKLSLVAADLKDGTVGDGKVGYTVTQGSAARIKEVSGLTIGVTWEPQFSALVIGDGHPFENLITTDQLFPHVTCCVLYGNAEYIEHNKDTSERLVWAVKNATDWLNWVVEDIDTNGYNASNPSHKALVDYAIKHAGGASSGLTQQQVLNAFKYIEYAWGDEKTGSFDSNNPMSHIKSDIATQTDTLYDMGGLVNNPLSDLGFKNSTEFADKFVNDSLIKAIREKGSYEVSDRLTTITLSVIVNDLHQLPTHLADEKLPGLSTLKPGLSEDSTLYTQAGLNVKFIDATGSNGVVTALTSNQAQFGVAAEPAVIIYDINNKQTTA